MATKRVQALDWIRGLACLGVVLYHYTTRYSELFPGAMGETACFSWGYMGVAVFFILSGYLSFAVLTGTESLGSFAVKKIKRLYPVYWIGVIVTFLLCTLFLPSRSVDMKSGIFNLTMLQSFVGIEPVDGAYWTLACELVFYAVVGVVAVTWKKGKAFPGIALAWSIALLLYRGWNSTSAVSTILGKLWIRDYGHMFLLGSSLFFLKKGKGWADGCLCLATIVLSVIYQFWVHPWEYGIFVLLAGALVFAAQEYEGRGGTYPAVLRAAMKPLTFLASISYPLYLLHQNIGYIILQELNRVGLQSPWIVGIPLGLMILVAYLLHRFVELPCARMKWPKKAS